MADRYYVSTALTTVLAANLGASGNPSVVSLPGSWPTEYPFPALIEWGDSAEEAILVTSAPTGTGPYSLPCTRGIDGTTAQAHSAGAQVAHGTTGYEPTQIQVNAAAIAALEAGIGGGAVALAGDLGNTTADPQVLSTHLTAPLPVNQGGTGSASQNWQGLLTPVTQTGTYTAAAGQLVKANIASASWTLTLPAAPAANTIVGAKVIANATGNANTLTVACSGSDKFETSTGGTTTTLFLANQAAAWQYNGGYWTRISDDLPLGQLNNQYQQVFSVKNYGAKCDGSTDDTTSVAATYAAAAGNGTVLFPPGTVTCVRGSINPAGAATWGPGATVRFLPGITTSASMFTPTAGCSFWGLTFDLNKANTTNSASLTDGAAVSAINAAGWADPVRLTQCKIINGWQCGLFFYTTGATSALTVPTSPFIVDGCEITGHGQIGIYAADVADGVVSNCYIHSNGASGIEEVTGLRNRFSGSTCVSNAGDGIVSEYSYGTTITGNTCTDNGISGIVIGGGSASVAAATHFTITGNTCRNNGHTSPGHGIQADTTITGSPATPVPAYGTITGNTCDSNVDHGIYVNNAQYVAVTGNVSNGNGDYGIELTCENATVTGNICTGNLGGISVGNGGGHQIGPNYTAGNTSFGYSDAGSIASTWTAGGTQSPGGTTQFLRADGTWDAPAGSGVTLAGDLGNTASVPEVISTHLTSPLPPAQGGVAGVSPMTYGAVFNGSTDDSADLNTAIGQGGTIVFPPGTTEVHANELQFSTSALHIRGSGMYDTTVQCTNGSLSTLWVYGSSFVTNVELSDMTLDGTGVGASAVAQLGNRLDRLRIRRCRFINWPSVIIQGGYAAEIIIEDCEADGAGLGLGTFFLSTNRQNESVIIRRNRLRWLNTGITIGSGSPAGAQYHSAYIDICDNYIDLGWWLLKTVSSNSGGTVTYGASTVTDSSAPFGATNSIAAGTTIRVLSPLQTGTLTTIGTQVTDSSGNFTTANVWRGHIVRSGTAFGVVSKVESATQLHVEEWLSQTTYQPVTPPSSASYTAYGVVLGATVSNTSTAITVGHGGGGLGGGWYDLQGNSVTPSSGTLYEVLPANPVYPIFCNVPTEKVKICRNTVRRGWGDNIEFFGSRGIITGNIVEDGQDEGIVAEGYSTTYPGVKTVIANNICRHNGTSGLILINQADCEVGPNQLEDNTWGAPSSYNIGQLELSNCVNTTVTGGRATNSGESAINQEGLQISGASTSGIKVIGFTGHGAAIADVYITSTVPAATCDLLDTDGVIGYQGTTNGQRLRVKGTGSPSGSVIASPGSQYLSTSGSGAGTTLYVKESGNGSSGWDVMAAGGSAVTSVTAGDTSIVVGGTGTAPTVETGTLDVIAAGHPAAADWSNNSHAITSVKDLAVSGLTGATAASRYAGATTSGAPASGTFSTGDFIVDQTGAVWVCTAGGTPGTWVAIGGATPIGKQAAYSSITASITPTITGSYSALSGAPSITLPNDSHTYKVELFVPTIEISVVGNVYLAIATSATGILNAALWDLVATARPYNAYVTAQSVTGTGQTVTVYAMNTAGSSTLTLACGAGGSSSTGPCELAAYRVA